jgi:hypothetical protein
MRRTITHSLRLSLCAGVILAAAPANAVNTVREVAPLSFGSMVVTGAAPQSVVIDPDGDEHHSGGIIPLNIRAVRNGVFNITGMSSPDSFYISIDDTVLSGPNDATFDITNFILDPSCTEDDPCAPDGDGNLTVRVGATLTTRPATVYAPGAYRGTYNFMIIF